MIIIVSSFCFAIPLLIILLFCWYYKWCISVVLWRWRRLCRIYGHFPQCFLNASFHASLLSLVSSDSWSVTSPPLEVSPSSASCPGGKRLGCWVRAELSSSSPSLSSYARCWMKAESERENTALTSVGGFNPNHLTTLNLHAFHLRLGSSLEAPRGRVDGFQLSFFLHSEKQPEPLCLIPLDPTRHPALISLDISSSDWSQYRSLQPSARSATSALISSESWQLEGFAAWCERLQSGERSVSPMELNWVSITIKHVKEHWRQNKWS